MGPVTLTGNALYPFVTDDRDLEFWTLAGSIEYRATTAWALMGEITPDSPDVLVTVGVTLGFY